MTGIQEAPAQNKPALAKIRTDVVGSLLRPEVVKEARIAFDDGRLSLEALRAIEDEAVRTRCGCRRILDSMSSPTAKCVG